MARNLFKFGTKHEITMGKIDGPPNNLTFLLTSQDLVTFLFCSYAVIPGKRSATRNPGFSIISGFRLSPE
jgi:hypothetical protein